MSRAVEDDDIANLVDDDEDLAGLGLGDDDVEVDVPNARTPEPAPESENGEQQSGVVDEGYAAEEAEEEVQEPAKKGKDDSAHMLEETRRLVSKMEVAIEVDAQSVLDGKPALRKIQMLSEIEEAVAKVKAHGILLRSGFVGLLKGFLEPLTTPKLGPNSVPVPTLPHSKVRAAVYRALQRLPISTHEQEGRDMLKAANIGPVLRFYSKVKDETPANRRLVTDLLNGWMAPIVEEGRKSVRDAVAEAEDREAALLDLKRRRNLERDVEARDAKRRAALQQGKKIGDAGYQYHARVPKASRPDYVKAPQIPESIRRMEQEKAPKEKGTRSRIKKATLALQRQQKGGDVRSSKVELSVKRVGNDLV